jgi:hypothetical protein
MSLYYTQTIINKEGQLVSTIGIDRMGLEDVLPVDNDKRESASPNKAALVSLWYVQTIGDDNKETVSASQTGLVSLWYTQTMGDGEKEPASTTRTY